jgi:pilus assembly protein Flp/PilA
MRALFVSLTRDESGVTAIECALIAALIAIVAVAMIGSIGTNLSTTYSKIAGAL